MFKQTKLDDYWDWEELNVNEESAVQNSDEDEEIENDPNKWFKNLYWSRIVSLQEDMPDQYERYPMADDILESSETINALELQNEAEYEFIFEPS